MNDKEKGDETTDHPTTQYPSIFPTEHEGEGEISKESAGQTVLKSRWDTSCIKRIVAAINTKTVERHFFIQPNVPCAM